VYFGGGGGAVYALNAGTGARLWRYYTGGPVESSPAVANGVVYAGCGANLCALNASTGAKLWSYAGGGGGTPAVANGVVYVGCSDGLCALNGSTGAKLWSSPAGGSALAVANGVVYVGSGPNVNALNASTGALLWSLAGCCGDFGSPAVANAVVYVGASFGTFFALNASTGAVLWGPYYVTQQSSPSIVDGVVYLTAADSIGNLNVFAFSLLGRADLYLRIRPNTTTVHQGDLITYALPSVESRTGQC
jgi:outer membrane protein assembly factor BamB